MAKSYPGEVNPGLFLPTTEVFDVGDLVEAGVDNERFRELLIRLAQVVNQSNSTINKKTTGLYPLEELVDGNVIFPDPSASLTGSTGTPFRQEFRKTVYNTSLSTVGTTTIAHGITLTSNLMFTKIYGVLNDTNNNIYLPLPHVDFGARGIGGRIEFEIIGSDIIVDPQTPADVGGFNKNVFILEYVKQ